MRLGLADLVRAMSLPWWADTNIAFRHYRGALGREAAATETTADTHTSRENTYTVPHRGHGIVTVPFLQIAGLGACIRRHSQLRSGSDLKQCTMARGAMSRTWRPAGSV